MITILDCYTDEPAGLGVPPYLGTYPRYLAGKLKADGEPYTYLTIDDIRFLNKKEEKREPQKTNIFAYNKTRDTVDEILDILKNTSTLYVIIGVHTPGTYLSAVPGTLGEVTRLLQALDLRADIILSGPGVYGTQLHGGRKQEKGDTSFFSKKDPLNYSYKEIDQYAVDGVSILEQIPQTRIIELETGRGCAYGRCSFCTEPLKNKVEFRDFTSVLREIEGLYKHGARHMRFGKQTCFFTYPRAKELLSQTHAIAPDLKTLHIDNVDPNIVRSKKGQALVHAVVKYCTPGNIAAFGVESFDPVVCEENNLNSRPEWVYDAVKIINKVGAVRGANGMPKFLPGINILFGLKGESKATHVYNMTWLKKFLDENLLLRRINIRQVTVYKETPLHQIGGTKYLRKNKSLYYKWRRDIREKIDYPMLQKLVPVGTILKDVMAAVHDGKTTFGRQLGTYPLIVGIPGERLPLREFINVRITKHMLRSVTGEVVKRSLSSTK